MTSSGPNPRKIKNVEDPTAAGVGSDGHKQEDDMDEACCQALSDIDECRKELDELNEKERLEVLEVENKFIKMRRPYYDKRVAVIDKIPNFWVNVVVNHPQISMLVDEEEEDCLHFLKKLEVEEFENAESGFRVKFVFDENPFFDNQELVKEFNLDPNTEPKSTSTGIKWKEQMDLSKKQPQIIKARRKRGKEPRTFFSWFSDNKNPAGDDIAEIIKDELWPDSLLFYPTPDKEDGDEEDGNEQASDESEEEEDMMDQETRQDIKECQKELDKLNDKAYEEVLQVKNKYNKLRKRCYDKRAAAIEKVPNFWAETMLNHPRISCLVYPDGEEEDCLNFLKKMEVEIFEDHEDGFRVKFVFDKNPYFDNQELVKEFINERYAEAKSTSTAIKWKEQMDLSKKPDVWKKRGLKEMTFFSWFSDNKNPAGDDIAGEVIRDDLWPNALEYYLKSGMEDEDEEDSDEDEEWEDMTDDDSNPENDDSNPENDDGVGNGEEEEDDDDEQVSAQ